MNKKRQTIWLVSMLSIMVILSAYYLFTDDVNEMDVATNDTVDGIVLDMLGGTGGLASAEGEEEGKGEDVAAEPAGSEEIVDETAGEEVKTDETAAKTDADILAEYEAQTVSGTEFFVGLATEREEAFNKDLERLNAIALDSGKSDAEVKKALEEIEVMRTQNESVISIEEQLMENYGNAVVMQKGNVWQVAVQAGNLEKSEAMSIIELVMAELKVGPESIRVKYMQ